MRKYTEQTKPHSLEIFCNCCGKQIRTDRDRIAEGVFSGHVQWGCFSEKDGEIHDFDLCEDCYDKWIASFQIPVEIKTENELL